MTSTPSPHLPSLQSSQWLFWPSYPQILAFSFSQLFSWPECEHHTLRKEGLQISLLKADEYLPPPFFFFLPIGWVHLSTWVYDHAHCLQALGHTFSCTLTSKCQEFSLELTLTVLALFSASRTSCLTVLKILWAIRVFTQPVGRTKRRFGSYRARCVDVTVFLLVLSSYGRLSKGKSRRSWSRKLWSSSIWRSRNVTRHSKSIMPS